MAESVGETGERERRRGETATDPELIGEEGEARRAECVRNNRPKSTPGGWPLLAPP